MATQKPRRRNAKPKGLPRGIAFDPERARQAGLRSAEKRRLAREAALQAGQGDDASDPSSAAPAGSAGAPGGAGLPRWQGDDYMPGRVYADPLTTPPPSATGAASGLGQKKFQKKSGGEYVPPSRKAVRDAIVLEDGQLLGNVMDPWQREDFEALDDPANRHAYLERPRAHSKTGDTGTEAVVELLSSPRPKVLLCFASDEDQARILYNDVRDKLIRGGHVQPDKKPLQPGKVRLGLREITAWSGSVLKVMAADVGSSWGLRPDWIACDEVVEWRYSALWESLWTATGKRPRARVIVISTAGWDKSHFSWDLRTMAEAETDWYFSSRGQCASWIKPEWLAQQERTLPRHVFQRLHLNLWVDGVGAFLTAEEVDSIFTDEIPTKSGAAAIGLDLGLTKDASVLARVIKIKDGPLWVDTLQTWRGTKKNKVELSLVEDAAYDLARSASTPIYFDPWQAIAIGQSLKRRGRYVVEYPFTAESRRKLFNIILDSIRSGRLKCQPHADLRKELLGLEVKDTLSGVYRVDHKVGRNDDHVVAVGLALSGVLMRGDQFDPIGWGYSKEFGRTITTPAVEPVEDPGSTILSVICGKCTHPFTGTEDKILRDAAKHWNEGGFEAHLKWRPTPTTIKEIEL